MDDNKYHTGSTQNPDSPPATGGIRTNSEPLSSTDINNGSVNNNQPTGTPVFNQAPPPAQVSNPQVQPPETAEKIGAGSIILQWLTYALWGWAILTLSFLSVGVILYYINNFDTSMFDEYSLAAVFILVPAAFIVDTFYSKHEQAKKIGASQVIMVIHAVLFSLFAVGTLIFAAFSIVTNLVSSGSHTYTNAELISAFIVFVYYCAAILRTVNPAKLRFITKWFRFFMAGTLFIFLILTIVGPIANVNKLKNDTLIDANLANVSSSIDDYATSNSSLPANISQVSLTGDNLSLFQKHLVDYKPALTIANNANTASNNAVANTNYSYQLCAHYKSATPSYSGGTESKSASYPDTTMHSAGYYCYNLTTY
jgi:hypothetical protein